MLVHHFQPCFGGAGLIGDVWEIVEVVADGPFVLGVGFVYVHHGKACTVFETLVELGDLWHDLPPGGSGDGAGDDDEGGIISPEHPSPMLHAPRGNIPLKDNPSLRYKC